MKDFKKHPTLLFDTSLKGVGEARLQTDTVIYYRIRLLNFKQAQDSNSRLKSSRKEEQNDL